MTYHFATPVFLLLLFLLPAAAWRRRRDPDRARPPALRHAGAGAMAGGRRSWRLLWQRAPSALRWVALVLAILGLARPQATQARQTVEGEGVDIALALDISGSMASLDFEPQNRLEAAKQVIREFIAARPHDRIGLVIFAQEAFNQSPTTADHAVLLRQLEQARLAPDLQLDDGTAIGLGLANAANLLKDSPSKSKVVILLTDGVNNAGEIDPLTAAEAAQALGIRVYAIGAGRSGQVPMPVPGPFGQEVVYQESVIDEETLKKVAETTGGQFFRAQDAAGLAEIYAQIDRLEPSRYEIRTFERHRELAGWLLVPAILVLVLELVLRHGVLRRLP